MTIEGLFHVIRVPDEGVVEVSYHRQPAQEVPPYQYSYKLIPSWNPTPEKWVVRSTVFTRPDRASFPWNELDQTICEDASSVSVSKHYLRVRYVLLPGGQPLLDAASSSSKAAMADEERRMEAFQRILDTLRKSVRRRSAGGSSNSGDNDLAIAVDGSGVCTRERPPQSALTVSLGNNMQSRLMALAAAQRLTGPVISRDRPSGELVNALLHADHGLHMFDRTWGTPSGRVCHNCFLGCDLVSWIVRRVQGVGSRDDACALAQSLLQSGCIERVTHDAEDAAASSTSSPATVTTPSPAAASATALAGGVSSPTTAAAASSQQQPAAAGRVAPFRDAPVFFRLVLPQGGDQRPMSGLPNEVHMASAGKPKRVVIDTDTDRKAERFEWAFLTHDATYHPSETFSFTLEWLQATACLMDSLVLLWMRRAQAASFLLVPVPCEPIHTFGPGDDPFRCPVRVSVQTVPGVPPVDLAMAVMCACDYLLDRTGSAAQPHFVHRTGGALAQIVDEGAAVLWIPNHVATARWRVADPSQLLRVLEILCASVDALQRIWAATKPVRRASGSETGRTVSDSSASPDAPQQLGQESVATTDRHDDSAAKTSTGGTDVDAH
jgi:hypothetical protein